MEGAEVGGDARTADDLFVELVHNSPLPIGLVDLSTTTFLAVSPSASELLGIDIDAPGEVASVTAEPDSTRAALDLMQRDVIDAYEARRNLVFHDGDTRRAALWVQSLVACGLPGRALVLLIATTGNDGVQELPRLDPTTPAVACGSTDEGWRVDRVSPEIERLLGLGSGLRSSSLPGRVHPDDSGRVSEALALTLADRAPVGVSVHMQQADGEWQPVRLVVAADQSHAQPRVGFALTDRRSTHAGGDTSSEASRAEILERTLQRITNEIQALGFTPSMAELPTAEELPELADLSARQWEIVTRLLRGERVPGIARAMFLSQSTVRNHLSAVFRKLGVHSQHELIEQLRARSGGSSSRS